MSAPSSGPKWVPVKLNFDWRFSEMYAVKRQFRIWRHELFTFWDKFSFVGRVVLGAVISMGLALAMVKSVIKPLNLELNEMRKDFVIPDNLDPEADKDILINRERAENMRGNLKEWQDRLASFKENAVVLREEAHLEVIQDLQDVFEQCKLRLISEQVDASTADGVQKKDGILHGVTHSYVIQGKYLQIQAMLLLAETLDWRFSIYDIVLKEMPNSHGLLTLTFKLDFLYLEQ